MPYRNQDDIPIFDTQEIPFSFGELFRTNRFVGADRQMDANNLSLALTTRLLEDATGEERLSASIGQIRYFDDQRVQLPGVPPTDFSGSTYAGEIDLRLTDRWRLTLDQQWNPNTDRTDLSAVTLQNRFGDSGVVNLSYRYRRDFLEQVDVSALMPITPAWRLIGRWNYALNDPTALPTDPNGQDGRTLERFIGIEHDSCCIAWRVLGAALDPHHRRRRRQRDLLRARVQGHRLAGPEDRRLPAPWYSRLSMTCMTTAPVSASCPGRPPA